MNHEIFMREAIKLADENISHQHGGPFGCVVVRQSEIVGRGQNLVTATNDPTAHAEVTAIRDACTRLKTFRLSDCTLYTSCEPCPMCLSAIYWARIPEIFFGNTREDAAKIGFDDALLYQQVALPPAQRRLQMQPLLRGEALSTFKNWSARADKIPY